MNPTKPSPTLNALAEGQMVIIIARWVLVLAGLFLILLDIQNVDLNIVKFEIMIILALAVSNFYLVAQVLAKRKTLDAAIYAAGLADLIVITLIIIAQGGYESNVYTFYFPAILAFSVAFPTAVLYLYLGGAVGVYGMIGLADFAVAGIHHTTGPDLQVLIIRLLMLAAVGVCGNYFAQLERNRRQAALQTHLRLLRLDEPEVAAPPMTQPAPTH